MLHTRRPRARASCRMTVTRDGGTCAHRAKMNSWTERIAPILRCIACCIGKDEAMRSIRLALMVTAWLAGACALAPATMAQTAPPSGNAAPTADNAVLLTVFFKHDQSRPLSELNAQLDKQGFRK